MEGERKMSSYLVYTKRVYESKSSLYNRKNINYETYFIDSNEHLSECKLQCNYIDEIKVFFSQEQLKSYLEDLLNTWERRGRLISNEEEDEDLHDRSLLPDEYYVLKRGLEIWKERDKYFEDKTEEDNG